MNPQTYGGIAADTYRQPEFGRQIARRDRRSGSTIRGMRATLYGSSVLIPVARRWPVTRLLGAHYGAGDPLSPIETAVASEAAFQRA